MELVLRPLRRGCPVATAETSKRPQRLRMLQGAGANCCCFSDSDKYRTIKKAGLGITFHPSFIPAWSFLLVSPIGRIQERRYLSGKVNRSFPTAASQRRLLKNWAWSWRARVTEENITYKPLLWTSSPSTFWCALTMYFLNYEFTYPPTLTDCTQLPAITNFVENVTLI